MWSFVHQFLGILNLFEHQIPESGPLFGIFSGFGSFWSTKTQSLVLCSADFRDFAFCLSTRIRSMVLCLQVFVLVQKVYILKHLTPESGPLFGTFCAIWIVLSTCVFTKWYVFPQTDLSVRVLAVLIREPVFMAHHRGDKCLLQFLVTIYTKSMIPSKTRYFLILVHGKWDSSWEG